MTLPPTAGIRLKILRALHDLDEIHVEEGQYLRTKPNSVRFEHYSDKGERLR